MITPRLCVIIYHKYCVQARVEALQAQRAALEAQEAALQEELRQADAVGIKRERSPIVLHGARSGDVIDLTEDD